MRPAIATALLLLALSPAHAGKRPPDIVDARTIIPDLVVDMRYLTHRNFLGRPVPGYRASICLLTRRAVEALKRVQDDLRPRGFALKVYDCYRPQTAVDAFAAWGRDLKDQKMKADFYPEIAKRSLFRAGYIARRSGHSRASTVDLTMVPLPVPAPPAVPDSAPIRACDRDRSARLPDESADMGSGFDCFGEISHTANSDIGAEQKANRRLLRSVMARHGFVNLPQEWWHFRLRDEPYPATYFDFPVE
jgi:D-alanyl-D-alanine dipeptidase